MVLILVYIVAGMVVLLITEGGEFLKQIVTLSIGGFFGFFLGYFGWVFAESIMESFNKRMER